MQSIQPNQQMMDLYQKAKTILVLDHPFFASILLRKPTVWTLGVPTAAMSCKSGTIYLNPEWIAEQQLNTQQMIFLLAHECMHYMLMHGARLHGRKHKAWNIACDKVINDTLIADNIGEFIDGGYHFNGARDHRAEDLYDESDDNGDGEGMGGTGDDLIDEPMTEGEQAEAQAQAKIDMAQAKQSAKMQGKMPASLQRLVESIINVPTPWYDILERHMVSFKRDDMSWSRPNRRHVANDLYLPGTNYTPEMGTVVIGVDTSGSITQHMLDHFSGHINRILEDCRPSEIHILYCDTRVAHHDQITCEDLPYKAVMHGGGGTDMRELFNHVFKHDINPDVMVVLTDMYTPFPDEAPAYSTVWLSTSSVTEAPFGEVLSYDINA